LSGELAKDYLMAIENQSTEDHAFTTGGILCTEYIRQEYEHNNCVFSAGMTTHPVDSMYLRIEKPGVEPTMLLLRPDELAAIAWCASGVLFSLHLNDVTEKTE
jgi:hypothetical protein